MSFQWVFVKTNSMRLRGAAFAPGCCEALWSCLRFFDIRQWLSGVQAHGP